MENFILFLQIGFRHILEGYDHLLFLAGLIIVTRELRTLLSVISAFTLAHSTTLILSALNLFSLKPAITETLIAASIAYVGLENLIRKDMNYRWIVAGAFGLIHGAGFSGHLTELLKSMLGISNIWAPLIGFNLGIELGQITVISLVYPLLWLLRKKERKPVSVPILSSIIAVAGLVMMIIRIWES